ncbi:MAG: hypothetical protein CMP71_04550 [Flavobacteriales bacterium]|nr:hypothetical protein [Flavobacteriales bacterium]|tara:strand:- start:59117 stop:61147 length:2031 start_codon:yes stop_codon:yes gene_type:complete
MILFQLSYPSYWIILCLNLSILLSYFLYCDKNSKKILKKNLVSFLLRLFSLFFISLLFLEPISKSFVYKKNKPIFLVFVDASESVNNYDLRNQLKGLISNHNKNVDIKTFHFSDKVYDGLPKNYNGKETNINSVFEFVKKKYLRKNVEGLLLISDGIINLGKNPIYNESINMFPVHCIGVGDTSQITDIRIENVNYNPVSFQNSIVTLELIVSADNLLGNNFDAKLISNGKNIQSFNFLVNENDFYKKIIYKVEVDSSGLNQFKFKVDSFQNEKIISNNSFDITIDVIESEYKILMLYDHVHPDAITIRKSLESDINVDFKILSVSDENIQFSGSDLILFSGIQVLEKLISEKIKKSEIPLLFLSNNGENLFKNFFDNISLNFGNNFFEVSPSLDTNFSSFKIDRNLINQFKNGPSLSTNYLKISGIKRPDIIFRQNVNGITNDNPLILIERDGVSKGIILAQNFWRQRMYDYKSNENYLKFDRFILDVCKSLILSSRKNKISVDYDKIVGINSKFNLRVKKFNKNFELDNNEDLYFECTNNFGDTIKKKITKNKDYYQLNLKLESIGKYKFKVFSEDTSSYHNSSFIVEDIDYENKFAQANHRLLKQISEKSDGTFLNYTEFKLFNEFISKKKFVSESEIESVNTVDIKKNEWILLILLMLIITEILIRRSSGKK